MKWGIIGAMPSEVEVLKQQMEDLNEIKVGRLLFWEGILCGQEAVVCCCGIGKVNAAITTQMMIDRFEVERIINTGIAFSIMPASVACWGIDGVVFRPVQGFKAKARTLLVYPRGSQDTGIRSFVSLIKPKR